MPPKQQKESKKTEQKKKEKVVEDKTFGLKNKKGAKQQKFIQQVHSQVNQKSFQQQQKEQQDKKSVKDKKQKELDELNALFKNVEENNLKSSKSKFASLNSAKPAAGAKNAVVSDSLQCVELGDATGPLRPEDAKITMWEDPRESMGICKEGESFKDRSSCKQFMQAVENKTWTREWICPVGADNCAFKHALPKGYVFKVEKKSDGTENLSLEDLIERERAMISDTTKVTLETFLIWKKKKLREKQEKQKLEAEKKRKEAQSNKTHGMSGKDLFIFNTKMREEQDDEGDEEGEVVDYKQRGAGGEGDEGEEGEDVFKNVQEINLEAFSLQIIEENEAELRRQKAEAAAKGESAASESTSTSSPVKKKEMSNGHMNGERTTCGETSSSRGQATGTSDPGDPGPSTSGGGGLQIDESLFAGEMEDLDISDDEDED